MDNSENVLEYVNDILRRLKKSINRITIIVIANVKHRTPTEDYSAFSVITDYYSESEFEEIVSAFRNFGFYVETYIDEEEFIKDVLLSKLNTDGREIIVYNTSQRGVGPGRHSLIPAFCKLKKIIYIGSNAYVTGLCRLKFHYNKILRSFHEHVPDAWLYDPVSGWLSDERPPEGSKLILKPIYEAASIGITNDSVITYSEDQDSKVDEIAQLLNQPIEAEQFIAGYEVEVPMLLGAQNFPIGTIGISINGETNLHNKIMTYDEVYDDKYSFYNFNSISESLAMKISDCAISSAQILGIEDYARIDFRIDQKENFFITDITTFPHTVIHSSFNFAFMQMKFTHTELMSALVGICMVRNRLL